MARREQDKDTDDGTQSCDLYQADRQDADDGTNHEAARIAEKDSCGMQVESQESEERSEKNQSEDNDLRRTEAQGGQDDCQSRE